VDDWIVGLAVELGEPPVSEEELDQVLRLAREVAHGVERKLAPVAAYLAGAHAGRLGLTEQSIRESALREVVSAALARLPAAPPIDPE
jgi:hypothetical protein